MDQNQQNDELYRQQYRNDNIDQLLADFTTGYDDNSNGNQQIKQENHNNNGNGAPTLSINIDSSNVQGGYDGSSNENLASSPFYADNEFVSHIIPSPIDTSGNSFKHHRSLSSHSDASSMVHHSPHLSAAASPYQSTFSSPYLAATVPQDEFTLSTSPHANSTTMGHAEMSHLEQQMTSNFSLLDNNPVFLDSPDGLTAPPLVQHHTQQQIAPQVVTTNADGQYNGELSATSNGDGVDTSFLTDYNGNLLPPPRTSRQRSQSDSDVREQQQQQQPQQQQQNYDSQGQNYSQSSNFLSPESAQGSSRRSRSASTSSSRSRSRSRSASRDYILELAAPTQSHKRVQKHPSTYGCHLCDKWFTRAYNLRSHLRTHTDERPFVCTVCGKAFARQHDRKRHEALHSGEKKFECRGFLADGKTTWGCGRKFARADALGRHFRTEAGRECIKPLLDEEKRERVNNPRPDTNQNNDQHVPIYVGGEETPSLMLSPPGENEPRAQQPQAQQQRQQQQQGFFLPTALLQQYPSLLNIDQSLSPLSGSDLEASDFDDGYVSNEH